jgi:hypothetical protein
VLPEEAAKFTGVQETLPDPSTVEEGTFCIVKDILYVQTKGKWISASSSSEVIKDPDESTSEENSCTIDGKSYKTIEEAIAAASFTGTKADITATFAGEKTSVVSGVNYDKAAIDTSKTKFTGAALELDVGDIAVAAKDVTVQ